MGRVRFIAILVLISTLTGCRSSREAATDNLSDMNWLLEYQQALDEGDKPHQSVTDLILQELRKRHFVDTRLTPLPGNASVSDDFESAVPSHIQVPEEEVPPARTVDEVLGISDEAEEYRSLLMEWVEAEDAVRRRELQQIIAQDDLSSRIRNPSEQVPTGPVRRTPMAADPVAQVLQDRDVTKQILRQTIQQSRAGTLNEVAEEEPDDWTTQPVMSHIRDWWVTRDILFDSTAALRYTPGDPLNGGPQIAEAMEERLREVQRTRMLEDYPELVRAEDEAMLAQADGNALDRNRRIYSWDPGMRGGSADNSFDDPAARSLGRRVSRGAALPPLMTGTRRTNAFKVFGYHPWWMRDTWQQYDYSVLDKLIFFDVRVNDQAGFQNLQGWPSQWESMIQSAQRNGTQVVPTVALLDNTPQFVNIFRSNTLTAALLRNTMDLVRRANADGIHLDFEIFSNVPPEARNGFTRYVALLRDELKAFKPQAQLTVFVTAFDHADALDEVALARYADHLIVQGYDMHWLTAPNAGPLGPLTGWNGANWETIVNRFVGMGIPREKLIMAVPYYGYEWPTVSDQPGAATRGAGREMTYAPVDPAYLPLIQINAQQRVAAHGLRRDPITNMPYYAFQGADGWYQGWFDDAQSLQQKYNFVKQQRLGGIAIFPLGYDGGQLNSVLVNSVR